MKKLLGIVVLGLLFIHNSNAVTIDYAIKISSKYDSFYDMKIKIAGRYDSFYDKKIKLAGRYDSFYDKKVCITGANSLNQETLKKLKLID